MNEAVHCHPPTRFPTIAKMRIKTYFSHNHGHFKRPHSVHVRHYNGNSRVRLLGVAEGEGAREVNLQWKGTWSYQ